MDFENAKIDKKLLSNVVDNIENNKIIINYYEKFSKECSVAFDSDLIKNKASRKMARKEFNQKLEVLKQNMYESFNSDQKDTIDNLIQAYDNFSIKSLEIETDYNQSHAEATEIISKLEDFLFRASKHQSLNVADYAKTFLNNLRLFSSTFSLIGS